MRSGLVAIAFLGLFTGIQNTSALVINVQDRDNFSSAQSSKLDQVVNALHQVINSAELRDRILNFTYQGKREFVQNNGLTNQQVYDTLMSAAEKFPAVTLPNERADIYLSIYYPPWYKRGSSAVAFTSTTDPYLNIYASYFNSSSVSELSDTIFHEWIHKLGFDHDYKSTARRPYSVPYGVGGIIYDLVKRNLGQ